MNNSGEALLDLQQRFDVPPGQFLIVCDDFQLPLGLLRLRLSGSDGGHNGLFSIITCLGSEDVPRLRCGIASESIPQEKSLLSRWVLQVFPESEQPIADAMSTRGAEACACAASEGMERAMNTYNRTPIL
ncbi:MAG: aminoacyl-tRNA hydrolase, partial [Bacteroidota bacterium]